MIGVSGSGKSTLGRMLAQRLGWSFGEADELHPATNVFKMASGTPLTSVDRKPWLDRVHARIAAQDAAGISSISACSALTRAYREVLREGLDTVEFAHLDGPASVMMARLRARSDHFMPPSLVPSQLEALEPLEPDEPGIVLDATVPVERNLQLLTKYLTGESEKVSQ